MTEIEQPWNDDRLNERRIHRMRLERQRRPYHADAGGTGEACARITSGYATCSQGSTTAQKHGSTETMVELQCRLVLSTSGDSVPGHREEVARLGMRELQRLIDAGSGR